MRTRENLFQVVLIAAVFAAIGARGETNTYTGASGGDWNVAGNWSLGTTPVSAHDVFVSLTGNSFVTDAYTINSLSIPHGAAGSTVLVLSTGANVTNNGLTSIGSATGTSILQVNTAGGNYSTTGIDMTGAGGSQIRLFNGTMNVGGGSGNITDSGAGTSVLQILGTGGTISAANVSLDQIVYGAQNQNGTFSVTSGQTYNMSQGVYMGQLITPTPVRTYTLNLSGGTLNAPTFSLNNANTANAASVVNLSDGRLNSTTIQRTWDGNAQTFNWTGGTIANTAGADLTLQRGGSATQNLVLTLTGNGTQTFEAEAGRTITVTGTANLAGDGTLTKTGAGNLIINSANTYTGGTTLDAGTLTLGNVNALSSGRVTVNDGTLNLNGLNATLTQLNGTGGTVALGGGDLKANMTAVNLTYAGSITGTGNFTKAGGAILTLSGNSNYTGDTFLEAGVIGLGIADALPTGSVLTFTANANTRRLRLQGFNQTLGGIDSTAATGETRIIEAAPDTVSDSPATLTLNVAADQTYNYNGLFRDAPNATNSALTLVKDGAGTQVLSGGVSVTHSGPTTVNAGVLELAGNNNVANASAMTVNAGGTVRFSGGGTRSLAIAGAGNVEKTGDNLLTLSGGNTYTGTTTIGAGGLIVDGSLAAGSAVSVAAGARLGGDGTIAGNLTLADGAFLVFDPTLSLTVSGTVALDDSFGVASLVKADGTAIDWTSVNDGTYNLLGDTASTFDTITNFGLAQAADIGDGRSAYFKNGSLQLVVIPEPATLGLFGVVGVALFAIRRIMMRG